MLDDVERAVRRDARAEASGDSLRAVNQHHWDNRHVKVRLCALAVRICIGEVRLILWPENEFCQRLQSCENIPRSGGIVTVLHSRAELALGVEQR